MLQLKDLRIEKKNVNDLSLTFRQNELVNIICEDRFIRKALFDILSGIKQYQGGELLINGFSTKTFKKHQWDMYRKCCIGIAYIVDLDRTVLETVELGLAITNMPSLLKRKKAITLLNEVGLAQELYLNLSQISHEKQILVAICKAVISNPPIIIYGYQEATNDILKVLNELSDDKLVITFINESKRQSVDREIIVDESHVIYDSHPTFVQDKIKGTFKVQAPSLYFKTILHIIGHHIKKHPWISLLLFLNLCTTIVKPVFLFSSMLIWSFIIGIQQRKELLFLKQVGASFFDLNKLVYIEMLVFCFIPMILSKNTIFSLLFLMMSVVFNAILIYISVE